MVLSLSYRKHYFLSQISENIIDKLRNTLLSIRTNDNPMQLGRLKCLNDTFNVINAFAFFKFTYLNTNILHCSKNKLNPMVWVRERTIPTERPPLIGEVIANFFADRGCHVVSVTDPYGRIPDFSTRAATFLSSSSSVVLTRLSGPRSRPTTFLFLLMPGIEPGPPDLCARRINFQLFIDKLIRRISCRYIPVLYLY
jgi:hypothetical protein